MRVGLGALHEAAAVERHAGAGHGVHHLVDDLCAPGGAVGPAAARPWHRGAGGGGRHGEDDRVGGAGAVDEQGAGELRAASESSKMARRLVYMW